MTASLTKKHFDALAAALSNTRPGVGSKSSLLDWQWKSDVGTVANVCARFNPNFDRARFLAACGVEE